MEGPGQEKQERNTSGQEGMQEAAAGQKGKIPRDKKRILLILCYSVLVLSVIAFIGLFAAYLVILEQGGKETGREREIAEEIPEEEQEEPGASSEEPAESAESGAEEETVSGEEETETGEEPAEEPEPRLPAKEYDPPAYDFTIEEVEISLPVSREYTFVWVSDVHMITDTEPGEGAEKEHIGYLKQRRNTLPVDKNGKHSEELWPEIINYINYTFPDGVIFGGDILDYCSARNMEVLEEGVAALDPSIPLLYIRADHDYGSWYGNEDFTAGRVKKLHREIDGDDDQEKRLDFGEFLVLGINASTTKSMPVKQFDWLSVQLGEAAKEAKPVILATHVPYASWTDPSLEELSRKVRNEIYYWGSSDPESRFIPEGKTWEFMLRLYEKDTVVKQVLCGHLHASWDGMISEELPQHIFGPAFEGHLGLIRVVPNGEESGKARLLPALNNLLGSGTVSANQSSAH